MNDETDKQGGSEEEGGEDVWAAALAEQEETEESAAAEAEPAAAEPDYAPAQFQNLQNEGGGDNGADVNMGVILDVPVTVSMEIGRTMISIRNLLQLNQGSVVELDRLAGEPMDVLVNGTLIAHGEVVVVNDKFGIRLTDVVSPADRIKNLKA